MGLFGRNYERAGSGIAKNAPKKKGFFRFMEIFGRKFWKLFELNLIYFVSFLPLIGVIVCFFLWINSILPYEIGIGAIAVLTLIFMLIFGPATAAHTKILKNFVMEKPTFLVHDFIYTFGSEFKHSCVIGFLDCLFGISVAASFYVYPQMIAETGKLIYYFLFAVMLSTGLVVLLMNFYTFLMMISTNLKLKNILKNSLALSVIALKRNAVTLLIVAAMVAVYVLPICFATLRVSMILLFLLPFLPASWIGLVITFQSYPVIQKYIINPYYEERGEVNPELLQSAQEEEEVVFEDMGGKEKPIEPPKNVGKKARSKNGAKQHKGKIIS